MAHDTQNAKARKSWVQIPLGYNQEALVHDRRVREREKEEEDEERGKRKKEEGEGEINKEERDIDYYY